jgi:hypothetical protein
MADGGEVGLTTFPPRRIMTPKPSSLSLMRAASGTSVAGTVAPVRSRE